jgi:malonate transporter
MGLADILALVLPAFGLIGVGFATARLRLLGDAVGEALASFVFTIGLPVLLMRSVAAASLPDASPWPFWLTYFAGVAVAWAAGQTIARRLLGQEAGAALIGGLVASFSNLVLLGIPIVYTAFGEAGAVPLLLLVPVHFPIMVTVATILFVRIDTGHGGDGHRWALVRRTLSSLARNPLMIGIAAGLLLRVSGVGIGGVAKTIVDQLADASAPLALVALGLGLNRYGIRGNLAAGFAMAVVKLVLLPGVVYLLASRVAALPPLWVAVATTLAACPTGANVFMFSTRFGVGHGVASNGITLSTLLAVVTMTGWIALVAAGL